MSLANNRKYTHNGEKHEEACFMDVVLFGKPAENAAQHLDKGDQVIVVGRIQQRKWETEDGQKRSKHELFGEKVHYTRVKKWQNSQGSSEQPSPDDDTW
jgi:single-strand DNA-binding protein